MRYGDGAMIARSCRKKQLCRVGSAGWWHERLLFTDNVTERLWGQGEQRSAVVPGKKRERFVDVHQSRSDPRREQGLPVS